MEQYYLKYSFYATETADSFLDNIFLLLNSLLVTDDMNYGKMTKLSRNVIHRHSRKRSVSD